jgi:hypothetical protein
MGREDEVREERSENAGFEQQWKQVWKVQKLLLLALIFGSCNLVDDLSMRGYIDPEIQPYVDSFVEEASKRGIDVNTAHLKISFKNLKDQNGVTNRIMHKIYIDPSSRGWLNEPERVVFHEMAHLYLRRHHDDSTMGEHGDYPKSIMTSVGGPNFRIHTFRREYYVNELFDPATPAPDWVQQLVPAQ